VAANPPTRALEVAANAAETSGLWHDSAAGSADLAEARQLAVYFAIDYLSWDETAPGRRDDALRHYLPDGTNPGLGWSGHGRQRASFAIPGRALPRGDTVAVDVGVLVTRYERRGPGPAEPNPPTPRADVARRPSSVPPATARGWHALEADWIRLVVPVRVGRGGRLEVDLRPVGANPPTTLGGD